LFAQARRRPAGSRNRLGRRRYGPRTSLVPFSLLAGGEGRRAQGRLGSLARRARKGTAVCRANSVGRSESFSNRSMSKAGNVVFIVSPFSRRLFLLGKDAARARRVHRPNGCSLSHQMD
jgi:hypothetical protein